MQPVISIIIAAYNYENYVGQCIESCLYQVGYDAFEVILVDDGSTDSTRAIAQQYAPKLNVITVPNGGVEKAANIGIDAARGEFIVRVDADDFLLPDYLKSLAPYCAQTDWIFLYPDYICVDMQGTLLRSVQLPSFDAEEIKERGDFLAGGTLYRKTFIDKLGGFNTQTPNCGLENYELILAILTAGGKGLHVAKSLFAYRTHDKNMSLVRRAAIIAYGEKLAKKFGLPAYRTNANHPYGLAL